MATTETTIKVTADTKQAERALGNLHSRLLDIGKVVVAGALVNQFLKIADSIDALNKASIKFGIDPAQFDALAKSAELAGISFDELTAGLQKLSINIGDALIKNTGPAAAGLAMVGLRAAEIANLPADQQLIKIKDALSGIENPALRSAIAMDILGKQGVKLLKAAEEADRLRQRFDEMGLSLSKVDTQGVENALDKLTEIKQIMEGAVAKAVASIAPYVEVAANAVIKFAETFGGPLVTALVAATRGLTAFFAVLLAAKVAGAVQAIVIGFVGIVTSIRSATTAAAAFNLVVGANPIVRVATIIGTITALFGGPLVDAALKFLGINQAVEKVVANTTEQVNARATATARDAESARISLAIKQLQLDVEENIIPALQEQVRLMGIKNNYGDAAYETEKQIGELAKKYNLSLEQARQAVGSRTAALQSQLLIQEKINQAVGRGRAALQEGTGPAAAAEKAYLDLLLVKKTTDKDAILGTELRLNRELSALAANLDQEYALRLQYDEKVRALTTMKSIMDQAGYSQDNEMYKSMLYAKETAFSEHIQRLVEMDKKRIEASRFNELQAQGASIMGYEAKKQAAQVFADFQMKSEFEQKQFAVEQAGQLFSALGAQNKKAFEAAKAFNIANAIMNTYMAATKALASYPPPFSFIAAAAAVGMGLAQVAQIRSQSYSGKALGGPVMGGTSYIVGESGPELFTPQGTGSITRNGDLGSNQPVNVNFTIVANDTTSFDALLNNRKGMIKQLISDAMLDKGQRF